MREIAPSVSRVAILFNPQTAAFARYYLDPFRSAAAALKIEPIEAKVHNVAEVESLITKLGREGGVGLIVMPDSSMPPYRSTIVSLAERYRLPAIYPASSWVTAGGLMCYSIDFDDLLRGAATYVNRILRGAKPNDLPGQMPTKFEMIINLKTAKALGLNIPAQLLATADEVVE